MINVITWLWRQKKSRTQYTASHVNAWASMVSRNLSMPHKLYCVTDMPEGITDDVQIIDFPKTFSGLSGEKWSSGHGKPQCYRRLDMFSLDAARTYGDRFVSMDLDCLVTGKLDALFDRDEDFLITRGTGPNRPYNGSMLMMDAGARPQVYDKISKDRINHSSRLFAGSDQAWLCYVLGWCEPVWGVSDGVYYYGDIYKKKQVIPDDSRIIFFPGEPKPWTTKDKRIKELYGRAK